MNRVVLLAGTTPKLRAWVVLAVLGVGAALASGRAELAALAAPFAVLAATGLLAAETPAIALDLEADAERLVEGDEVALTAVLRREPPGGETDVVIGIPPVAAVVSDRTGDGTGDGAWTVRARAGEVERALCVRVQLPRWGNHQLGPATVRTEDGLGVREWHARPDGLIPVRVLPSGATLRRLVEPVRTRTTSGMQVVRSTGGGIEFAETRPYQLGDAARSVNWKVTARRGVPYTNARHAERSADVVLVLDVFADRSDGGAHGLELGVRAAGSLAAAYLGARNRVGLVVLGGMVDWLLPGTGRRALDRIVDRLLAARAVASDAAVQMDFLARTALPPRSLAVAITPLHDDRVLDALVGLRRRGHDLFVVRLLPGEPVAEEVARSLRPDDWWLSRWWRAHVRPKYRRRLPMSGSPSIDAATSAELAVRLWQLELQRRERMLENIGVVVVRWDGTSALDAQLDAAVVARRRPPGA